MLDIAFIRNNTAAVAEAARAKGMTVDLDRILALDTALRLGKTRIETLRAERNRITAQFAEASAPLRAAGAERSRAIASALTALQGNAGETEQTLRDLLLTVPNLPWPGATVGPDEKSNQVVRAVGDRPDFAFPPLDHLAIADRHGWIDQSRIAKVAGARSYVLKGRLALLEQALLFDTSRRLAREGFQPIAVPALVRGNAFVNTGHFPFAREDTFELPRDGAYLAGTAEIALTGLHGGEIIDERDLPLLYAGFSPCFRREAGSGGRDVRGLLRVHQFYKVEQYVICRDDPEESAHWHGRLLANAETVLQALELPYQVVECSTGDMGPGKVRMNDIETWVPSLGCYRETHSCSTLHDWQARRANIRWRDRRGQVRFCHTLNNTAIAMPRILVPLIENHQTPQGQVRVPTFLRNYLDGEELL
ncbi:serine--tRNA ligase [Labrys portucalensis]|uniref:Serine--tRNA ligase n=1 Tax=Labrys neptuniae TaxID=376174 RepID=A0ABV6ZD60_9HYPH